MYRSLAGGIAHDFNNLLTGNLGNVSLARSDVAPDSELVLYLQQIDASARRTAELCRQMLAYSGRSLFVIQRLDLNALITGLKPLLNASLGEFTGRGLGLAALLGIVRGHQGAIQVASEPDRGCTFRIYLPCAPLLAATEV